LRCKYEEFFDAITVVKLALPPAWGRRMQVLAFKSPQRHEAGLTVKISNSNIMELD
jgi:hypothetical protein